MINFSEKLKKFCPTFSFVFVCVFNIIMLLCIIYIIILDFVAFLVLTIFSIIKNQSILIDLKKKLNV